MSFLQRCVSIPSRRSPLVFSTLQQRSQITGVRLASGTDKPHTTGGSVGLFLPLTLSPHGNPSANEIPCQSRRRPRKNFLKVWKRRSRTRFTIPRLQSPMLPVTALYRSPSRRLHRRLWRRRCQMLFMIQVPRAIRLVDREVVVGRFRSS